MVRTIGNCVFIIILSVFGQNYEMCMWLWLDTEGKSQII